MKISKIFLFSFFLTAILVSSCAIREGFQPPPPMFKSYVKQGTSEAETKQAMLECGYPNVFGGGRQDTSNDVAIREQCMFKKGFTYRSGYQGICSLKNQNILQACRSDTWKAPSKEDAGLSTDSGSLNAGSCYGMPTNDECRKFWIK